MIQALPWYDSVWYCVSCRKPYVHQKTPGRTCEPLGGSCSITTAALTQFVTLGLFSDIVVMEYSSATAQLIYVFAYEEVEKSAPWSRDQPNRNADDGHLEVKPRLWHHHLVEREESETWYHAPTRHHDIDLNTKATAHLRYQREGLRRREQPLSSPDPNIRRWDTE